MRAHLRLEREVQRVDATVQRARRRLDGTPGEHLAGVRGDVEIVAQKRREAGVVLRGGGMVGVSSCQRARASARGGSGSKFTATRARGVCGGEARGARDAASGTHPHRKKGVRPRGRILRRRRHPRGARSDLTSTQRLAPMGNPKARCFSLVSSATGSVRCHRSSRCPDSSSAALPPPRPRASRRAVSSGRVLFRLANERRFLGAHSTPRTSALPSPSRLGGVPGIRFSPSSAVGASPPRPPWGTRR